MDIQGVFSVALRLHNNPSFSETRHCAGIPRLRPGDNTPYKFSQQDEETVNRPSDSANQAVGTGIVDNSAAYEGIRYINRTKRSEINQQPEENTSNPPVTLTTTENNPSPFEFSLEEIFQEDQTEDESTPDSQEDESHNERQHKLIWEISKN